MGRRTFVKGLGASAAAAGGLASSASAQDNTTNTTDTSTSGVDLKDAILTAGAYAAAGPVAFGWALREFEIIGSDPPPEGLTPGALHQKVYEVAKVRRSANKSTFVDNRNILDGVEHNAYIEAKTAAIEALNAGKSQSDAQADAIAAIDDYQTTIETNLLQSWNEAVAEADAIYSQVSAIADLNTSDVFDVNDISNWNAISFQLDSVSHTLPDGTSLPVHEWNIDVDWFDNAGTGTTYDYDKSASPLGATVNDNGDGGSPSNVIGPAVVQPDSGDTQPWLNFDDWKAVYDELTTKFTNVRDGIILWLDTVYSDVQSGDIEIGDLVTPRQRASMMGGDTSENQAAADLVALNMNVDPDNEATITIDSTGATLTGTFALTNSADGPIEPDTTYDPGTFTGDVYFTADMSLVEGEWTDYQSAVDAGVISLSAEPYDGTSIEVTTDADETVVIPSSDFTETDAGGVWTFDATAALETTTTSIASARYVSTSTEANWQTILLDETFTVDSIVNANGETVNQTDFTSSTPQDDSNYITQDEWNQLEQRNKELIEKYEQSQSGGGIDLGQFDMFGIPGEMVAVGAAAIVGFLTLSN